MSPALIELIIALAPYGVRVIEILVGALTYALMGGRSVETLAEVSKNILDGIQRDHPDWSAAQQAQWAADALVIWHRDHPAV